MPNQATRRRRRAVDMPTNMKTLKCDERVYRVSRLGDKPCTTRFLVVGNSPDVTMCWIGDLLGSQTGFRLFPHINYTVWKFNSVDEANCAIDRFRSRAIIELPWYVPNLMRTHPMYLMELLNPDTDLVKL